MDTCGKISASRDGSRDMVREGHVQWNVIKPWLRAVESFFLLFSSSS